MVLPDRIELSTSSLPMKCSTTELRQPRFGGPPPQIEAGNVVRSLPWRGGPRRKRGSHARPRIRVDRRRAGVKQLNRLYQPCCQPGAAAILQHGPSGGRVADVTRSALRPSENEDLVDRWRPGTDFERRRRRPVERPREVGSPTSFKTPLPALRPPLCSSRGSLSGSPLKIAQRRFRIAPFMTLPA